MEQALSSFNVAAEIQQYVADSLNKSVELSALNIHWIAENNLDVEFQIKNALQRQGIACVVMTPKMTYTGNDGSHNAWNLDDLTIQAVEYVPVNRAKNKLSCATALDVVSFAAEYLTSPTGAIPYGTFCAKTIELGEDDNLLVAKLTLDTQALCDPCGSIEPISGQTHISKYATVEQLCQTSAFLDNKIETISAQISSLIPTEMLNWLSASVISLSGEVIDISADVQILSSDIDAVDDKVDDLSASTSLFNTRLQSYLSSLSIVDPRKASTKQISEALNAVISALTEISRI